MRSVSCGVKRFLSPLQGSPGPGALPRVPPFRLHPRLYSCRRFAAPEPASFSGSRTCTTDCYGAFSVSHSHIDMVTKYIAGQEEHHKKVSFQEELLSFLRKQGIEFDERYIWK